MTWSVPEEISEITAKVPRRAWEPLGSDGDATRVWAVGDVVVKMTPPGAARAEADRLAWLGARVPAAEVVAVIEGLAAEDAATDGAGHDWLVTARLAGHPAHRVAHHGDTETIAATLAAALKAVHDLTVVVEDFPFAVGWESLAATVSAGAVDTAALPDPYCRYDTRSLVEIWASTRPATEELVVCHGKALAPNLVVDPQPVGWVDVGRLCLADRHLDLAAAQHSLHRHLGPPAVFAFFEAYGADPDLVRLDHYLLAQLLVP